MKSHLEIRNLEGRPQESGRDPREMSIEELNSLGHHKTPLRKVIRANCISCCGGISSEVRSCTLVDCVFWPYRMNKNPFSERRGNPNAFGRAASAKNN